MLYLICCTMYCILCCILYCIMYWWLAKLWQMTPGRRKWSCRQPLPDATWTQTDDTAEINIIRPNKPTMLWTIDMSKLFGLWHPRKSEYIFFSSELFLVETMIWRRDSFKFVTFRADHDGHNWNWQLNDNWQCWLISAKCTLYKQLFHNNNIEHLPWLVCIWGLEAGPW